MFWPIVVLFVLSAALQICDLRLPEKAKYKRPVKYLIICATASIAVLGIVSSRPTSADPGIEDLQFYANGIPRTFNFCCEFSVVNRGDRACKLLHVEFLSDNINFTIGRTALVTKGRTYLGFNGVLPSVVSSRLPTTISGKERRSFVFVGSGSSNLTSSDFTQPIQIGVTFESGQKHVTISPKGIATAAIQVQNVEL